MNCYKILLLGISAAAAFSGCKMKTTETAVSGDAASKVYVAPGKYDEFYNFVSGGFSGQVSVYGLPSGRLLRVIPAFSQNPENGYGYNEETKPMLQTSQGFIPWDDQHHLALSQTNGEHDGRWIFANANNTPRVARIDLKTFKTTEILELPNSGGNHSSPFITENTEYVIAGTRFAVPIADKEAAINNESFKANFKSTVSFIGVNQQTGQMGVSFQVILPGMDLDLSRAGKGPSHGWFFFSTYNTEQASTLLEVNASQKDKDFIVAVNWKKAEEYIKAGKGTKMATQYYRNTYNEETHSATSELLKEVLTLDPTVIKDFVYMIPCPKSPHGCDVDPTGEYIVGSGKLAALIPVFSFQKFTQAIQNKTFEGDYYGIPVIKYEAALHGEVQKPGLGPLHTEFDGKGNAYTSMFLSSEIVKWNIKDLKVLDRVPTYYSIGHLMVPGGDTKKPYGKYVVAYNKITKDRYLPTGPELSQSAQLYSIEGDKMQLLLDYPTIGEPHYAQAIAADKIKNQSVKFFDINKNKHPFVALGEKNTKVVRSGNRVDVYMTAIRSHLTPDNIEGVELGDEVYFHVTNLEQDWDIPHGFAIKHADNAELLVMPGETNTLKFVPKKAGVYPFYCTDFCSALHQEMQGYLRVSPKGAGVPLKWRTGEPEAKTEK
ncbi:Sec-dependent nitrous-oxide reductase [Sediminibacterium soli]|uniref:Sec-dependent nitrous-oxide reductase n=1 Tax=Sediminibacterium soli TaxID=2698829 RepID=UPI001379A742|nr:Sec-dependent nitrous-oxide reductase [Sediminibacterium soli]NCI46269.1 Sec-dependent nitrous-oxide reductase [Sediminibacterium soli]